MIWYKGGQINIDKGKNKYEYKKTVLKIQNIGLIEATNKSSEDIAPK